MRRARLGAAAALAAALAAAAAGAHQTSLSYSTWELDAKGAFVRARISQLDLSRLGLAFEGGAAGADPVAAYLEGHLGLSAGGIRCAATSAPTPREAPEGWTDYAWRVSCGAGGARSIESTLFLDVAPSHLHFTRVVDADGHSTERVLSEAEPRWNLPAAAAAPVAGPQRGSTLVDYVSLGIEHILTGWDHIAFALALLLLAANLREVAVLATSFTAAHSVTLALATLGVVRPPAAPVEAMIGFSIALVAAENVWIVSGRGRAVPFAIAAGLLALLAAPVCTVPRLALAGLALFSLCHFGWLALSQRPAALRAAVAFAFGLIHGFGFAGVLAQLELPREHLVPALFGFNFGVELGQLSVVAVAWPLLWALARAGGARAAALAAEAGSAAVCGLGVYWFLVRSLG